MKQCSRCGQPYEDVLPFCLKCEGYEAISYVTAGNYLSVTYRKKAAPSMWREPDEPQRKV
jgi:hypothetical protein